MTADFSPTTLERWRLLKEEAFQDPDWLKDCQKRAAVFSQIRVDMKALLSRYLSEEIETEAFRAAFDKRSRTEWDGFGFKGMSGAMFLNKLVKHLPDRAESARHLRAVLPAPSDIEEAKRSMRGFWDYLSASIQKGHVSKASIQPARLPFFISIWWNVQTSDDWPFFFISARDALSREELFVSTQDSVTDYFDFRETSVALARALEVDGWTLACLCERHSKKTAASETVDESSRTPREEAPANPTDPPKEEGSAHARVQWVLATIGRKLGCRVWIAANDRNKTWDGKRLGDLSLPELPALGMDPATQRQVGLIDVLWLKGSHQVIAAFEVEHTTSIYSGLLRLSDLTVLAPNLSFPLYIVVPANRLELVRQQLSRPTFQSLELHKRCGYFSEETLFSEAENIMRWARDPSAIDGLASKVEDTRTDEE